MSQSSQSKNKEEFQNTTYYPFQPVRIAAFSLNSSRTAFAKRKQEAQVERLTTQFKHANAILITNAMWWRGAKRRGVDSGGESVLCE